MGLILNCSIHFIQRNSKAKVKTFDLVNPRILLTNFKECGINPATINWVKLFFNWHLIIPGWGWNWFHTRLGYNSFLSHHILGRSLFPGTSIRRPGGREEGFQVTLKTTSFNKALLQPSLTYENKIFSTIFVINRYFLFRYLFSSTLFRSYLKQPLDSVS